MFFGLHIIVLGTGCVSTAKKHTALCALTSKKGPRPCRGVFPLSSCHRRQGPEQCDASMVLSEDAIRTQPAGTLHGKDWLRHRTPSAPTSSLDMIPRTSNIIYSVLFWTNFILPWEMVLNRYKHHHASILQRNLTLKEQNKYLGNSKKKVVLHR